MNEATLPLGVNDYLYSVTRDCKPQLVKVRTCADRSASPSKLGNERPISPARSRMWNYLVCSGLCVIFYLSVGTFREDGLRAIRETWNDRGQPTEFVQDLIGARGLQQGTNPYPVLSQGAEQFDLAWPIAHRSTHPPTAFLLAVPLASLPWNTATGWWIVAMLGLLTVTAIALGLRYAAFPVTVASLLWAPAAWSMVQLTPFWLAGLVIAWRLQSRPLWAGAVIGVAALAKLVPALALGPFLWRRQWTALVGFGGVWLVALGLLALLGAPDALVRYLVLMVEVGQEQATRTDNAALLLAAHSRWGGVGLILAGALVVAVLGRALVQLRGVRELGFTQFGSWVWLTVALLPVAWDYSLLPLLPWLAVAVWRGRPHVAVLAGVALALPMLLWDADNSLLITIAIAAAGLAIVGQAQGTPAIILELAGPARVGVQGECEAELLTPA
jgi:hypothetical protein